MGNKVPQKLPEMSSQKVYSDSAYKGEMEDDVPHGQGKMTFSDGSVYKGEFKNGDRHGKGVQCFKNGHVFNGYFENDVPVSGTYVNKKHTIYEGEFIKGFILEGKDCIINHSNGNKYIGDVFNDKPHGKGTMNYKTGDQYVGEFKEGFRHGYGTFTRKSGEVYKGQFEKDIPTVGTYINTKGVIWKGTFIGDYYLQGEDCTITTSDYTYTGGVSKDKKDGKGVTIWKNGNTYVGEYKNDLRYGKGIMTWANENVYDGEWKDGVIQGQGTFTWANGNVYKGTFSDGKRNGFGITTWAELETKGSEYVEVRFEGTWKDNKMHEGILRKRTPQHTFIDFSIPGHVPIQDGTRIAALEDKVKVLTEMVEKLQDLP